ncbi:MAG: virulence RhuM family protein, partial [Thiomicrorhabdus sp.]|nr:virulence RhuM family protein [Thiomicrorhabdus sp.]
VSGFFDYIENIVERRNTFDMQDFAESVNKFLAFNEYKILDGYGKVTRKQANQKAFLEYEKFNKTQAIESDFDRELKQLEKQSLQTDRKQDKKP